MFKDARVLDQQRTAASFDKALGDYTAKAESWYNGSVGSIDSRLSHCDRLLHSVAATMARIPASQSGRYLHAAEGLESDRRSLQGLREDLLTGASGRANVTRSSAQRTAKKGNALPDDENEDTCHHPKMGGSDRRWVELEAAKFLAANQDTLDDHDELSTRAASYAELKTSTFSPEHSSAVTAAFVRKVATLAKQAYVPVQMRQASVDVSFAAEAMFL